MYIPDSKGAGPLFKTNKTECNNLLKFVDIDSIQLMFYLISFFDFCKYLLTLNLMPATCFKKVWTGATKDRVSCGMFKNLFGRFYGITGLLVGPYEYERGGVTSPIPSASSGSVTNIV